MKARLSYGGQRVAIGAVGGVDVGDHLGTCARNMLPAGVDRLQKGQVAILDNHNNILKEYAIESGFAEMFDNKLLVLID